jgi:multiple sugar transport system substrate-binding protein
MYAMLPRNAPRQSATWLAFVCLMLAATGCPQPNSQPAPPSAAGSLAGIQFQLLVVDDPALAKAAERLRGEWHAQTGSDFTVVNTTGKDLAAAMSLDTDGIVVPSAMLGTLAARRQIAPLPEKLLRGDNGDYADHDLNSEIGHHSANGDRGQSDSWGDIFDLLQLHEAVWGNQIVAVPMGSPVLTCYYRADLLEKLHQRPPQTWEEYQELAQRLGEQKLAAGAGPWHGALEPLGPGWAGLVLLARAAPYAKHRDNYSALFDIETMEPLVAGEPFVRALEELVAAAKQGPREQLQFDPAAVRGEFWRGHCGMALSWPTAAAGKPLPPGGHADSDSDRDRKAIRVGFAELPGSPQAYNVGSKTWEPLGEGVDPHVPLLGLSGRVGVVAAGTKHPEAVLQLLLWLSGERWSGQVCAASPATTLFRHAHVKSPRPWTEPPISPAAAAQYAALTEKTLGRSDYLFALRLPGRAEYLAALDNAVHAAVLGDATPAVALKEAAGRWRAITRRLGLHQQRTAYRQDLGVEDQARRERN